MCESVYMLTFCLPLGQTVAYVATVACWSIQLGNTAWRCTLNQQQIVSDVIQTSSCQSPGNSESGVFYAHRLVIGEQLKTEETNLDKMSHYAIFLEVAKPKAIFRNNTPTRKYWTTTYEHQQIKRHYQGYCASTNH